MYTFSLIDAFNQGYSEKVFEIYDKIQKENPFLPLSSQIKSDNRIELKEVIHAVLIMNSSQQICAVLQRLGYSLDDAFEVRLGKVIAKHRQEIKKGNVLGKERQYF